jgi:hypothetical protein
MKNTKSFKLKGISVCKLPKHLRELIPTLQIDAEISVKLDKGRIVTKDRVIKLDSDDVDAVVRAAMCKSTNGSD